MLPEDYILKFVQTTIDVMTPPISQERPELLSDWRESLQAMQAAARKENQSEDVDFFGTLLNILEEKPVYLASDHPYQAYLADMHQRINAQNKVYGQMLIQQQRQAYQQLTELTLAVMTHQPEQKAQTLELIQGLFKNLVRFGSHSHDEAIYYMLLESIIKETPLKIDADHPYAALQDQMLAKIKAYHVQNNVD